MRVVAQAFDPYVYIRHESPPTPSDHDNDDTTAAITTPPRVHYKRRNHAHTQGSGIDGAESRLPPCLHVAGLAVFPPICSLPHARADRPTEHRNAHYPPHTHATATTHLIIGGHMTISRESGEKQTFGPGALVDVGERQLHEVWIGSGGCEYVVGERLGT